MQPIQQHGRRLPSFSWLTTRSTCSFRVSANFTKVTQQIHSLRASGVRPCHNAKAARSAPRALRKSAGKVWAVPGAILCLAIYLLISFQFRRYGRNHQQSRNYEQTHSHSAGAVVAFVRSNNHFPNEHQADQAESTMPNSA